MTKHLGPVIFKRAWCLSEDVKELIKKIKLKKDQEDEGFFLGNFVSKVNSAF